MFCGGHEKRMCDDFYVQLPECLRIIGYIRRIGVFSESEMRLQVRYMIDHYNHTHNLSNHFIWKFVILLRRL